MEDRRDRLRIDKRRSTVSSELGRSIPIRSSDMFGSPREPKENGSANGRALSEGDAIKDSSYNRGHQRARSLLNDPDNEKLSHELLRRYGTSAYGGRSPTQSDSTMRSKSGSEQRSLSGPRSSAFLTMRARVAPSTEEEFSQYLNTLGNSVRGTPKEAKDELMKQQQALSRKSIPTPKYGNLPSKRRLESVGKVEETPAGFHFGGPDPETNGMMSNNSINPPQGSTKTPAPSETRRAFSTRLYDTMKANESLNEETSLDTMQEYDSSLQEKSSLMEPSYQGDGSVLEHVSLIADEINATSHKDDWIDVTIPKKASKKRRRISSTALVNTNGREIRRASNEPPPPQRGFLLDPMAPGILSAYIQTIFNLGLLSIFVYFFFLIFSTIRHDINQKVEEYSSDILEEMTHCSHEYVRNNCYPGKRVPALEHMCLQWERCMNQDPAVVGRAKVSAETFAEILNGFIEPISMKSMLFIVILCAGAFLVNNLAFGFNTKRYLASLPVTKQLEGPSVDAGRSQQQLIMTDSPQGDSPNQNSRGSTRKSITYRYHTGSTRKPSRKASSLKSL